MVPLNISRKLQEKNNSMEPEMNAETPPEADIDIDLREVYFLIMHFLSSGPCKKTCGQLWNELLEHHLLPRRYHAWYSRRGASSGDDDDDGVSLPLCYLNLVERYPHVESNHLVKLLKQLIISSSSLRGINGGNFPSAADVPTLLGSGSFSLLGSMDTDDKGVNRLPRYLRWPHMRADQVRGLSLREIGGGFTKHHRSPSVRAACYAIAKPSTMVQKMQIIKTLRGHMNAVYCATFDRSGRYVITGSDDRLVKIWSMETAFCLASCRGHEGDITDLAVSSNNAVVASSSNDFSIRVWRLPDGLPISVLRGHTSAVTAIAFNPRLSCVYHLLSSSDDGTCRIWDARNSQSKPRMYIPKPPDMVAGKNTDPSPSSCQQSRQILCCAFNATGTVFVAGSSDTYARVWNCSRSSPDDSEQPIYEMDLLAGHENDVNYVQFSGCAVPSRSTNTDILKEDNVPKFKNSWFTHDNIVTCSRDGSAIIWIPRSRRSHGKVGRWTRAYHLKVPPPPMPPQPPRGGPRQRFQPTPRGVNMIVWSLDNRFVLAAIMDCRICVWNASDGSLVHSLMGHTESTFVLDVHPFNPRIAMSAGYDGRTILWDIWEGTPVQIYETGRFKLVDGKFSPDGTSIVLSDEVGQIFIIATGQGESQKDAKYDQFFLGDYRPLIQDTLGNVLDQETQLQPYHRNQQDLLCDYSMIPYPEPYQNMYQQRRLGNLGSEWRPPSVKYVVGPTYNINTGEYQMLPPPDLERWAEPLPEFLDAIDWEPDIEVHSDDTDSEYNVTEEYSSEGDHEILSNSSCGDVECSAEDGEGEDGSKERLRRSRRKKHKSEVEFTTSSGRRVKRRKFEEHDETVARPHKKRKFKSGRLAKKKKSLTSKPPRPQRRAARNALSLFSKMNGVSSDDEDENVSETSASEESESVFPDSFTQSNESEKSLQSSQVELAGDKKGLNVELEDVAGPSQVSEVQTNEGTRRRLVLKLPRRDPKINASLQVTRPGYRESDGIVHMLPDKEGSTLVGTNSSAFEKVHSSGGSDAGMDHILLQNGKYAKPKVENLDQGDLSLGCSGSSIRWGEVKTRSSKRLRFGDSVGTAWGADGTSVSHNDVSGHLKGENECMMSSISGDIPAGKGSERKGQLEHDASLGDVTRKDPMPESTEVPLPFENLAPNINHQNQVAPIAICNGIRTELSSSPVKECQHEIRVADGQHGGSNMVADGTASNARESEPTGQPTYRKLRIKSKGLLGSTPSKLLIEHQKNAECDLMTSRVANEQSWTSIAEEDAPGRSPPNDNRNDMSLDVSQENGGPSRGNMYTAVYKRSKSARYKNHIDGDFRNGETSNSNNVDKTDANVDDICNAITGTKEELNPSVNVLREEGSYASMPISDVGRKSVRNLCDNLLDNKLRSNSRMTVGFRSTRNRRENYASPETRPVDRRKCYQSVRKPSWLMLMEHEESYRYIPQLGDEVAYLRQGHEEYVKTSRLSDEQVPWKSIKNLKAVEFCKVHKLDYSSSPGSGESCCKLSLEFVDPSSSGYGKVFKLTLPELVSFPDFIVERTHYDAALERNWTHRDKCQVWWRNEGGDGGSWYEGRVMAVRPKSPEFPDSPWERYIVLYKNDGSAPHLHSPWELHDADSQWEHPQIDEKSRNKLLASISKIEQTSSRNQDSHGIQKLSQVAQKSDYLNRYPVPVSLELIKMRLDNNYYRTIEAVKHDISVMLSNAESYFGKNTEMLTKMRRLREWMDRFMSSL